MNIEEVKRNVARGAEAAADVRRVLNRAATSLDGAAQTVLAATKGTSKGDPEAIAQRLRLAKQQVEAAGAAIGVAVAAAEQFGRGL